MGRKPPYKMSNLDRAKQFAPFSALSGLDKALRRREAQAEGRKDLAEDAAEDMDALLRTLVPGQHVTVVYYHRSAYRTASGVLSALDARSGTLTVDGETIAFSDLYSMETD